MNKYEKQIAELKDEYENAYNEYVKALNQAYGDAQMHCLAYNDQIARINASRDNLLNEISVLYKFLRKFGSLDKKITPFDYVTEKSRFIDKDVLNSSSFENKTYSSPGLVKTASVAAMVAAPVILPAIWIGDTLFKRSKDKAELERMTLEFENEKNKWSKALNDKKREGKFYKDAEQIAFLYQSLILTVSAAIKETILPELEGIDAFLIADAIKNSIISDMNPNDAEIEKIDFYRGTIYDCHYTFVMNAFDYYNTIVTMFTTPILTNIVSDNKVTASEKKEFESQCKLVESKTLELAQISVFEGEN